MNKNRGRPRYVQRRHSNFSKVLWIAGIGLGGCLIAVVGVLIFKSIFPPENMDSSLIASSGEIQASSSVEEHSSAEVSSVVSESSSETSQSEAPASSAPSENSSKEQSTTNVTTTTGDFSDALFIGDSRTEALKIYGVADGASFLTHKGLMVNTAFTKPVIRTESGTMTVVDALKQEPQCKRVYIMLGVNELGWPNVQTFIDDYAKLIDAIRESQPNATIYVQSILPVSQKKSDTDSIYNNPRINQFNEQIEKMAKEKGVVYLAVNEALMDDTGALPVGASTDGVHPNIDYCRKWAEYLKANVQ